MASTKVNDVVDHPVHYNRHPSGIECIDIVEHMGFCIGNAIKYIWRADLKGGLEDLEKAKWYLEREIAKRTLTGLIGNVGSVERKESYDETQSAAGTCEQTCAPNVPVESARSESTAEQNARDSSLLCEDTASKTPRIPYSRWMFACATTHVLDGTISMSECVFATADEAMEIATKSVRVSPSFVKDPAGGYIAQTYDYLIRVFEVPTKVYCRIPGYPTT